MYTLGDIPRTGAISYPDRTAIVYEGRRWTYHEFNQRINRLANALAAQGCEKGQRLTVMADNCSRYLEVYFAAAKLGMSVTPLNTRLGDDELAFVTNDSEATRLMVGDGYEEKVLALKPRFSNIETWISLDNRLGGFLDYETLLADASDAEPDLDAYDVQEDDLAILMYTGGTTGIPKGVMLSHRNCVISGTQAALAMNLNRDDATCYVLPIFHVSWWPILAIMSVCGKVCINRKPNLDMIFKLIQDEHCTHMNLVPTIYGWMVDYPDVKKYDLTSLRLLSYAGSPFPVEILVRCIRKYGNIFCQGYGSTETAGAPVTMLGWDDHQLEGPKTKYLSSAGKAAPCSRVRIVDDNDKPVPTGEIGEVCVKGKHIMIGYWKNPKLTSDVMRGGWLHMGDMGYMDADGHVFLTDRKADMIISGGENVYPKEVEDIIYQHPAVQECSVVSAPDAKWGEIVQAVVVLKSNQKATEQDIIEHCKRKLAGYKCPKAVVFWDAIPKTIVGKIEKKKIKEKLWEGKKRRIS